MSRHAAAPASDIHGHEVLEMMLATGAAYDAAGLESAIVAQFGPTARFCTCSASGMTAAELVAFLAARGKFVPTGAGFTTSAERICGH